MWFRRKIRNRRLGREHVLDVKLRSSQVRAVRARMAAVALGVVFVAVSGIYLLWRGGEWMLDCLVYENNTFSLRRMDVQTDGVIAVDQLQRWAGVRAGQNLLALDLARVKRDLELVPWVQAASVERILPHTLRLRIIEREPLAQINLPRPAPNGRLELAPFYLDSEGYAMLPLQAIERSAPTAQNPDQFPVISGLLGTEVQIGRRVESPQAQAALQLLAAFEHSPMEGLLDIKRVDVASPEVLLVTTSQGSEITLPLTDSERQLRRWQAVFELGHRLNKVVATLDLAVTNNVPVTWLDGSSLPPETPKRHKPPRKKHV